MIVCHEHRFIFLKTVKVGGTSAEIALSKFCGPEDVITPISPEDEEARAALGYPGPRNFDTPPPGGDFARPAYNHMPAEEARRFLGSRIWNSYFKFSIARDPFDQLVSLFYFRKANHRPALAWQFASFETFVMANPQEIIRNRNIMRIAGRDAMDRVLRYETLRGDLSEVGRHLGLPGDPGVELGRLKAKSGLRPHEAETSGLFDAAPRARALVELLAAVEVERFGHAEAQPV